MPNIVLYHLYNAAGHELAVVARAGAVGGEQGGGCCGDGHHRGGRAEGAIIACCNRSDYVKCPTVNYVFDILYYRTVLFWVYPVRIFDRQIIKFIPC